MAVQEWHYRKGKGRFGPVTSADLKRMASTGELGPDDLVRGVGMSEWVPASKIKGLFAGAKPKVEEELGLTGEVPKVPEKPVAPQRPKPAPSPPPVAPAAAPVSPFGVQDDSNPFAQFGLNQSTPDPNDPFAIAEARQSAFAASSGDPFASAPGAGFGGVSFDNLAALGSQGQAIHREPPPETEDPFAAKKKPAKKNTATIASNFGPAGAIGALIAPFGAILFLGFAIGALFGVMFTFVMGGIARFFALCFMFMMASGVAKALGFFAGNCLLQVKIKNEILSLAYGFFLGLFALYVFLAGTAYTVVNCNPFRDMMDEDPTEVAVAQREMDEDGRSLVLRPDEAPVFPDPDAAPAEKNVAVEEEDAEMTFDASGGETDGEGGEMEENEEFAADEEWGGGELTPEQQKDIESWMAWGERVSKKLRNGISMFEAFGPFWVFFFGFLMTNFIFWLIAGCSLVFGTARATWMANLGFDPTRD